MNFLERLQKRWQLNSLGQVVTVLIVFALTGFSVMFLKQPLFKWIGTDPAYSTYFTILYYIFILPIYNLILLFYGFLFGQFQFFWTFEKKMWNRMKGQKTNEDAK